jgi:hypothetical protein
VKRPSDELFARSGFSGDQHWFVRGGVVPRPLLELGYERMGSRKDFQKLPLAPPKRFVLRSQALILFRQLSA